MNSHNAARELTLDAAQAARNSRTASRPLDRNQIKKLLDSRNEREVLDGLRRVISVRLLTALTSSAGSPCRH
jgi:AP-3 complex subunit beta